MEVTIDHTRFRLRRFGELGALPQASSPEELAIILFVVDGALAFSEAKVSNLDMAVGSDEDVVGLEIAVHVAHLVKGLETQSDLCRIECRDPLR